MKNVIILFLLIVGTLFGQNDDRAPSNLSEQTVQNRSFGNSIDGLRVIIIDSDGNIVTTSVGAAFDSTLTANRVAVINSPVFHYTATEVLMDTTNGAVMSSYVYFNMASYKSATIAFNFDDSTSATIYGSIYSDADLTDETSGDWGNLSTAVIGADSVAFGTNQNYNITESDCPLEWVLIKYNKWGTLNSVDIAAKKGN